MICKWCNQPNPENTKFCTHCGKELNNTNNLNSSQEQNTYNNNLGQNNYQNNNFNNQPQKQEEKANIWLAILSWFIPLAGLIIFIVKKDKEPKTAKVSGICALISFILNIVIIILTFSLLFSTTGLILGTIFDQEQEIIEDYENNYDYDYDFDYEDDYNDDQTTNDATSSTDWQNYEIIINNKTLTLPASYNDIASATNASLKSADTKSYLESNYYTILNMYKNDKLALYVELTNYSDSDALYTECQVTRVSQTEYHISQGAEPIIFPGGLKAGDEITESKIIELFGNPDDTNEYSSDGYESKTYLYVEDTTWTTSNNYEITVVNGIIDELQLDNRN